ncbi:bifunctional phosphatase IMPL2, chloroplastic [Silene latifolia]|uniref:bifunctional phosphatase IMPL2, chloroplastic n=1 Tax=Silene latifolia TaxID=37657 RepID=UPI003D7808F9
MHTQTHFLSLPSPRTSTFRSPSKPSFPIPTLNPNQFRASSFSSQFNLSLSTTKLLSPPMAAAMAVPSNSNISLQSELTDDDLVRFADVANQLADAAGVVIRKFFRNKFDIVDKDDLSPVTIADRTAEESMVAILMEKFPSHAIFGEENGWRCKEKHSDYVWVLDPIDGTKSFITGKPLFGTLIALLYKGQPILGIINQPILEERWIGIVGRRTTLNGQEVSTRSCAALSQAYLYTTSPHLFAGAAEDAFIRVRNKVKVPLYGCDCYAYALLASGFVDLVIESGLKPYDFLALIPVIKGAGGSISDWAGKELCWEASPESHPAGFNVVAAGDAKLHQQAVESLEWQ